MNALIPLLLFLFESDNVLDNDTKAAMNNTKQTMKLFISPGKEKLYQAVIFIWLPKQNKKNTVIRKRRNLRLTGTSISQRIYSDAWLQMKILPPSV